jgi:hypothetical protein
MPAVSSSILVILLVPLAAALGVYGLLVGSQKRAHRQERRLAAWAHATGFTISSALDMAGAQALPEDLRRLPFFRRRWEPATAYWLERDEVSGGLRTIIFDAAAWWETETPLWMPRGLHRRLVHQTLIAFRQDKLGLAEFKLCSAEISEKSRSGDPPWCRLDRFPRPRLVQDYTLYAEDSSQIERMFSRDAIDVLENEPGWGIEGLGEWFLTFYYHRADRFWSRPGVNFDHGLAPERLSARLEGARRLFRLMTAGLG